MKRMLFLPIILFLFTGAALSQFEGVLHMKIVSYSDGDSTVMDAVMSLKGRNFASTIRETGEGGEEIGKYIMRGEEKVFWIVSDREKKYIEFPIPDDKSEQDGGGDLPEGTTPGYSLKKTGKTQKISGYACEEWIADDGEGRVAAIWATSELGEIYGSVVDFFDQMSDESGVEGGHWESALAAKKLFPVRVTRMEDGELSETEEIISIERKTVPGSVFEAPKGYEKQSLDLDFQKLFEGMMQGDDGDTPAEPDTSDMQ